MPEELLDIYKENGEFIGSKARVLVHAEGDWHKVAHIYVVNKQGQLLVHLRSPFKDSHPNQWDTRFGGHVPSGGDYAETAAKELKEEIGLDAKEMFLMPAWPDKFISGANYEFVQSYIVKYDDDATDLKFNDGEVVAVKWMSLEQIAETVMENPHDWVSGEEDIKKIFEKIKENLKNAF